MSAIPSSEPFLMGDVVRLLGLGERYVKKKRGRPEYEKLQTGNMRPAMCITRGGQEVELPGWHPSSY